MATFTYPGVYIQELSSGQHTITGVSTSTAVFIGWAAMGPVDEAVLIQSWSDFQTRFGGLDARSLLGYSVSQFFTNGGSECYVIRLVWDGTITGGLNNPVACSTAVANGVGYGVAGLTATLGGVSETVSLGVGSPVLDGISVLPVGVTVASGGSMPTLPPLPNGASLKLAANGLFSDKSTGAPAGVTWVSSSPAVATVSAAGVVTAVGTSGTATITATSGMISGSLVVTVTGATLQSITVAPAHVNVAVGQVVQMSAAANYSDGSSPDVTALAVWSCTDAGAVSWVSTAAQPLQAGQFVAAAVTPAAPPDTKITAALPAAWTLPAAPTSNAAVLIVTAATLVEMGISPGNATVPLHLEAGQSYPTAFAVAGIYTNGAGAAPTVTWSSSNPAVASVDANSGDLTVDAAGETTITATYTPSGGGTPITASTALTVVNAHMTGMTVTPSTFSLAGGLTQQMAATGIFDDGSSADLTGFVNWSALAAGASVSNSGLVKGGTGITAATPVGIQAQWLGVQQKANATILPPVVTSIAVATNPAATNIAPGANVSVKATATYSDLTTGDVTNTVAWSTTTPALLSVVGPGVVQAAAAGGSLTLFASSPGAWGNTLLVTVSISPLNNTRFNLLVQQEQKTTGQIVTLESFSNLSVTTSDPNYVVTVINADSNYITFRNPATGANVVPTATPAATAAVGLVGGADGTVLEPNDKNFELAMTQSTTAGYQLLERVDIFNLLCVPGESDAPTVSTLQEYCATKRAFMIVDSPEHATISGLMSSGPVGSTTGSITGTYAGNSAFYFPWVQAPDPLVGNRLGLFPPCGFVAGIYAMTDATRGVWKAPAGIGAGLTGNAGLQYVVTELEQGMLNPQAVNCLREFKVYGDVVWGARTLAGNDHAGSEWKYVPIRRLALFLESSLYDGTQWVVFEPNDETLWGQIRMNVGSFMQGLFLQGAFAGSTPQTAYFVKCDGENNPPASVAQGVVKILVGFAPLYPAEFVLIEIQQMLPQVS